MVISAGLPVGFGSPQVGLHLEQPGVPLDLILQLRPLWRQCLDLCLVDDVLCQALASQWTVGLVLLGAAALSLPQGSLALADDLGVVAGDDVTNIRERPVAHLDRLPVEGLVTWVARREAFVKDSEELLADIGDDRSAEGGIEPTDVLLPLPPPLPLLPRLEYIYIYIYITQ